jgi:hypothetical protein
MMNQATRQKLDLTQERVAYYFVIAVEVITEMETYSLIRHGKLMFIVSTEDLHQELDYCFNLLRRYNRVQSP